MALAGSISYLSSPTPRDSRPKLLDRAIARAGLRFSKVGSRRRSMRYLISSDDSHKKWPSSSSTLLNVRSLQSSAANSEGISKMAVLLEVEGYMLHCSQTFWYCSLCSALSLFSLSTCWHVCPLMPSGRDIRFVSFTVCGSRRSNRTA
jgi:hypothetical protein